MPLRRAPSMKTDAPLPKFIVDCHVLEQFASSGSNAIRAKLLDGFSSGDIAIPSRVWAEFVELYPEAADEIEAVNPAILPLLPAHRAQAGILASRANSGFRPEPYHNTDWLAAATAEASKRPLITVSRKVGFYAQMLTVETIDISTV
jgi:hypothetical protein